MKPPLQYRKNMLLTAVRAAQNSVRWLGEQATALQGDVDAGELRVVAESIRRAQSALETIEQVADRIGAER